MLLLLLLLLLVVVVVVVVVVLRSKATAGNLLYRVFSLQRNQLME
jgi:preprotein translocase subunit SecG